MFKKKLLKNKKIFFLLVIYTIVHIFFCTNNFYTYFINPLFWLSYIIFHYDLKLPKKKEINITLIISTIFFLLYLISGFVLSFNKNISNCSFINIWKVILPIYGIEIIRYKLIKSNKNNSKAITLITILIIISEINFKELFLSHNIILFHYIVSIVIPIIAQNILFTYLSLNSHYSISIIIRVFNEIPKLFLPIIPYSDWFIKGSFSLIKTLIIYYIFKYYVFHKKSIYDFKESKKLYSFTIITSIILVLFMLGLFNYKPIAILSNSMSPLFKRGDVVIYKKEENILPDDIIAFKYENQTIIHRVIGINEYYVTKGDANNTIDYIKIKKEDIKGVYKFHIKYLGYPAIWLNELVTKEN